MTYPRVARYAKEYKKYGIRYSSAPQVSTLLAGVVQVSDTHGRGFVYIRYAPALIEAIGKALPSGVSEEQPCYLKVVHTTTSMRWKVFAFYIGSPVGVLLWEVEEKPLWLKRVRRDNHGKSKKE